MYYTMLLTLVYACIHLFKNLKIGRLRWRLPKNAVLHLLIMVIGGVTNGVSAQNLRLAYFGETITHYGLRGGMEYNLRHTEKSKPNGRVATNELYFGLALTAYCHPHNHIGLILAPAGARLKSKNTETLARGRSPNLARLILSGSACPPWRYRMMSDRRLARS